VISNSVLIERYVKLIFKDLVSIFLIVFLSISLLGIASAISNERVPEAIANYYFSFSTPLNSSSVSYQTNCLIK